MSKLTHIAIKRATPSPRYVGFWPAMQDVGDGRTTFLDASGQGRHLQLGVNATYAQLTGTPQYATIVGSANAQDKSLFSTGAFQWDLALGQSLVLQCTMNAAAPGANAFVFGSRGAGGDTKGFALRMEASGRPVVEIRDTGTTYASSVPTNSAPNIACDGTDRIVQVIINGTTKTAQIRIAGVPTSTTTPPQAITATGGTTQSDDPIRWGGAGDFVASSVPTWVNGANLLLRHMHLLVMPTHPANIEAILAELLRNPHRPLSNKLLP